MKCFLSKNKIILILLLCSFLLTINCDVEYTLSPMISTNLNNKNINTDSQVLQNPEIRKSFSQGPSLSPSLRKNNPKLNDSKTSNTISGLTRIASPIQVIPAMQVQRDISIPTRIMPNCPCAGLVKCQPCGVVVTTQEKPIECGCAPKLDCPVCPPMSLIHEMAAKKALNDQRSTSNLRGFTSKMNTAIQSINKYSGDVVKYEMKAKEMAQKMEEASLKSIYARKNMIKVGVKYRLYIIY